MTKSMTIEIEIDEELLERAQRALGSLTTRETVEEALRRAAAQSKVDFEARRRRQLEYLDSLDKHLDLDVLASDEMWR